MRVTRSQTRKAKLRKSETSEPTSSKQEEEIRLKEKQEETPESKKQKATKRQKKETKDIDSKKEPTVAQYNNKEKEPKVSRKNGSRKKLEVVEKNIKTKEEEQSVENAKKQIVLYESTENIYSGSDLSNTESEYESEEEEENFDNLLDKAEAVLTSQQVDICLKNKQNIFRKLSKMKTDLNQSLYFQTREGVSKLKDIDFVGDQSKDSCSKALFVRSSALENRSSSRKERQQEREKTTGKEWFNMPRTGITPEIKRDLQVLKMRHVLDRKRHYKKTNQKESPKYFQMGTVIEGPTEFFSARLTKKERKQTIVDELMANEEQKHYFKRKYNQVSEKAKSGGKRDYKKMKAKRK